MPVKEGGSAGGEDEDRMSCSADSRRGYPKMGKVVCRGLQTALEMHKGGTNLPIFGLCQRDRGHFLEKGRVI